MFVTVKLFPLFSTAPFSFVVKKVPAGIFKDAVLAVAVPAFKCKIAVGAVTPIPTLPDEFMRILSIRVFVAVVEKTISDGTTPVETVPFTILVISVPPISEVPSYADAEIEPKYVPFVTDVGDVLEPPVL